MKIAVFDSHTFERPVFETLNQAYAYELKFFNVRLTEETAELAKGFDVVCCFTNDRLNAAVIDILKGGDVKMIALRSAGFNHVDLASAKRAGIRVARVPAYSPNAIAEYATLLILALNRKICRASTRVHDLNFSLDGLVGFDLNGKTIGIIGTGKIGAVMAKIMRGFGCNVIAYDKMPDQALAKDLGLRYVELDELYRISDIISLHVPLNTSSKHLIDAKAFTAMKPGVMLINTGRGALIETKALISALKSGHIGSAGLDVYEEEETIFSHDLSAGVLQDDVLARLLTFPNVLITAHQAFLTNEALEGIVGTILLNIQDFALGNPLKNEVLS